MGTSLSLPDGILVLWTIPRLWSGRCGSAGVGSDLNGAEAGVQRVAGEQLAPLAFRQPPPELSGGTALRFLLSHMADPEG